MADTATQAQTRPIVSALDPVHLHAKALNAINRIRRELLQTPTDYDLIADQLHSATSALETLRIVDAFQVHSGALA